MTSARSTAELVELVSANSRAVAYDLVEPISRFLMVARERFDGDLDKALIMLIVTLRSSGHPEFRKGAVARLAGRNVLPGFGSNMRSIADSTGVAKETVRRKVQQLIDVGWVVKQGRNLCYSVKGYEAVSEVRDSIIQMYARGFQVLSALERELSAGDA